MGPYFAFDPGVFKATRWHEPAWRPQFVQCMVDVRKKFRASLRDAIALPLTGRTGTSASDGHRRGA